MHELRRGCRAPARLIPTVPPLARARLQEWASPAPWCTRRSELPTTQPDHAYLFPPGVPRRHDRLDAPAHVEVTDHFHRAWLTRLHQIVEDPVDGSLIENAVVPEAPQIQLQALELETHFCRDVRDEDRPEIRCAPLELLELLCVGLDAANRTQRCELVALHPDLVFAI